MQNENTVLQLATCIKKETNIFTHLLNLAVSDKTSPSSPTIPTASDESDCDYDGSPASAPSAPSSHRYYETPNPAAAPDTHKTCHRWDKCDSKAPAAAQKDSAAPPRCRAISVDFCFGSMLARCFWRFLDLLVVRRFATGERLYKRSPCSLGVLCPCWGVSIGRWIGVVERCAGCLRCNGPWNLGRRWFLNELTVVFWYASKLLNLSFRIKVIRNLGRKVVPRSSTLSQN